MDNLSDCVDALIRSTGADDLDRLVSDFRQGGFDTGLHTTAMFLNLPSTVVRARVFETGREFHRSYRVIQPNPGAEAKRPASRTQWSRTNAMTMMPKGKSHWTRGGGSNLPMRT